MDNSYLDNFLLDDFYVDLTEEDMFNVFGRKDMGIPLNLTETDIFSIFKFIGIGVPFELTKGEMTDIVLCLKRIKANKKYKINKRDDMKILISEDENGKILLN